jgi:hypothetical protein
MPVSGSAYRGSNPWGAANLFKHLAVGDSSKTSRRNIFVVTTRFRTAWIVGDSRRNKLEPQQVAASVAFHFADAGQKFRLQHSFIGIGALRLRVPVPNSCDHAIFLSQRCFVPCSPIRVQ